MQELAEDCLSLCDGGAGLGLEKEADALELAAILRHAGPVTTLFFPVTTLFIPVTTSFIPVTTPFIPVATFKMSDPLQHHSSP